MLKDKFMKKTSNQRKIRKELLVKKLFALNMEMQVSCDNEDGKTYSHTTNCDCERLNKEQVLLQKELKNYEL